MDQNIQYICLAFLSQPVICIYLKFSIGYTFYKNNTSMTFSFSSDTNKQVVNDDFNMLTNNSLERTSSFLTSSPCTFVSPEIPCLLHIKIL